MADDVSIKFLFRTEPETFAFANYPVGYMSNLVFYDSILNYFPVMSFSLKDEAAVFSEQNLFTKFLKAKTEVFDLVNDNSNFNHDYYFSKNSIDGLLSKEYVIGVNDYQFHSYFRKQDSVKNVSHKGNIDSIVRKIMSKYIYIDRPPTLNISSTSNFDTWYQIKENDYEFIKKLSKYAFNINKQNSPFITFINLKGEFYFQTYSEMIDQKPVDTYILTKDEDSTLEKTLGRNYIKTLNLNNLSTNEVIDFLKIDFYNLNNQGVYKNKEVSLKDKLKDSRISLNKYPIRSEDLKSVTKIENFGIVDNDSQENHYKGWTNSFFKDLILNSIVLTLNVPFDTRLCSGKVIELKLKSPIDEKNNESLEFSGVWLILQSTHYIDEKGLGSTNLLISKSTINIYKKNIFYNDYL